MSTQPTQDPVPSELTRDLKFNAGKIDEFVTSMGWTYTDRFGNKHYTIEGINYLAQQVMNAFGYVTLTGVSFTTGATVSNPNEVLFNEPNNEYYKWTGSFSGGPKVVPANSTPESTGGIGAGKWLSVGDSTLRAELAEPDGSGMVGHGDKTVDDALTELEKTQGKDGFNSIGRFLNLAELRAFPPSAVGDVVFVASAASSSATEIHHGGGYFQSVAKGSLVDDDGMTIVPFSGSFAWCRIGYENVYIEYFGAKGDGVTDSTTAIIAAMNYGKSKKVSIHAGAGIFETSSTIPVWGRSGIIGKGRDQTIFEKTTNTPYIISTGVTADAFICVLPEVYSPDGTDITNYAILTTLDGFTIRRKGLTGRENAVAYGIWAGKVAASQFKNLRVECGNFGFWGGDVFSNTFESLQFLGLGVGQYCGFQISRYRSGVYALSGTSNVLTLVGVAGYQFGFMLDSLQYSTMNSCTADGIRPMSGTTETQASPYRFTNPHGITMNGCGSEGVSGERLTLIMDDFAVYDGAITINSYQGQIVQENPKVASTPIFRIQSTSAKFLSVSIINCNIKKDPSLSNQGVGFINGANTQVFNIGSIINVPGLSGGATFKSL